LVENKIATPISFQQFISLGTPLLDSCPLRFQPAELYFIETTHHVEAVGYAEETEKVQLLSEAELDSGWKLCGVVLY
jgi:hypothetical protein